MNETNDPKKNVLVLYGFHPQENYARDVALALRDLHMDGVVVEESPRRRYFLRLLKKYKADWVLDLHDDMGLYELESEPFPLATIDHTWPDEPKKKSDPVWRAKVEKVHNLLKIFREQTYGVKPLVSPAFYITPASGSYDPRVIGIELYVGRPLSQSLDFLKKLTNYLQTVDL